MRVVGVALLALCLAAAGGLQGCSPPKAEQRAPQQAAPPPQEAPPQPEGPSRQEGPPQPEGPQAPSTTPSGPPSAFPETKGPPQAPAPVVIPDPIAAAAAAFRSIDIVYRKPEALAYKRATPFVLIVAAKDLEAARQHAGRYPGQEVVAPVMLGDHVKAVLSGPPNQVTIAANGPDTRLVSGQANTTWTWTVTPVTADPVWLELKLFNVAKVNGEDELIEGPAYTDRFPVKISRQDSFIRWIEHTDPIWKWLAAVGALIGVVLGWWRMRKKPAAPGA